MRWHLVWLLGTFALSGCGADGHLPTEMVNAPVPFASAPERPKPSEKATVRKIELSKEQKKAVEQAVTRKLKDPGSAKFRNLVASASTTGATAVCGLVNAKDSTGGYVGERAFMGSFDASQPKAFAVAEWWGVDANKDHFDVLELCAGVGLHLN